MGFGAAAPRWPTLFVTVCLAVFVSACVRSSAGLRLAGSTSVQPLAELLAEAYARAGGGRLEIQGGGSTAGVQAVLTGVADVGMISRSLSQAEAAQGLVAHRVGLDVLAVVVHTSNPIDSLTSAQVRTLFDGTVQNWREVGGRPGPIHLISREAGSGSRDAFRTLVGPISPKAIVLNSSGAIRVGVMDDPQAIGYVSLGTANLGGVKMLGVDGRRPGDHRFPLVRSLSFVTKGRPLPAAEALIRFVRSPEGRAVVEEEGLVSVGE